MSSVRGTGALGAAEPARRRAGSETPSVAAPRASVVAVQPGRAHPRVTITGGVPGIQQSDDAAIWLVDQVTTPIVGGLAVTGSLRAIGSGEPVSTIAIVA